MPGFGIGIAQPAPPMVREVVLEASCVFDRDVARKAVFDKGVAVALVMETED